MSKKRPALPDPVVDEHGMPPRPEPTQPRVIEALRADSLPDGLPENAFADDQPPRDWVVRDQASPGDGGILAQDILQGDAKAIDNLRSLKGKAWIEESYPDFNPAIDINVICDGEHDRICLLACTVVLSEDVLARLCLGLVGENAKGRIWINGIELAHGDFVSLSRGCYAIVVEVDTGQPRAWQWDGRRLSTRITTVTSDDIKAYDQWRLARWERIAQGRQLNDDELAEAIEIDESTIRGKAGFYRVAKDTDGKWWLVNPQGKAEYYRGICALNRGGTGGRRMGKPAIPRSTVNDWLDTLQQWNYNHLGSWTTPEFFELGVPHTDMIDTFYVDPWLSFKFPDVFDPRWRHHLEARCRYICSPQRNSPNLVGYFLENERGFMETLKRGIEIESNAPTFLATEVQEHRQVVNAAEPVLNAERLGLLQFVLSVDDQLPGGKRAWDFVLERYGSLVELGKAWGVPLKSRLTINEMTINGIRLISEQYLKDENDFARIWINQYFKVSTESVRKFDDNHLILGVRWATTPSTIALEEETKWVEVASQNNYRAEFVSRLAYTTEQVDMPLLIGEFQATIDSATFLRNPIEPPGGYTDPLERRDMRITDAMDSLFRHPPVIGYTLYKWGGSKPTIDRIADLWQANHRSMATRCGHPSQQRDGRETFHGQIFIGLQTGIVEVEELPSPEGHKNSKRISRDALYLGLVAREGKFDKRVYGNGIRGRIVEQKVNGKTAEIEIEIDRILGEYALAEGQGRYRITLEQQGPTVGGHFDGAYDGHPTEGKVIGHLHRELATTRL